MNLQYKIWDKANKQWVKPPYCINQYGDLQVKNVILTNMNDFEIVVYTGLRDKKRTAEYPEGQKIFEGDIVVFGDWPPKIVEYSTSGFAGFGLKGTMKFLMNYDSAELEVIGNIYESDMEGIT